MPRDDGQLSLQLQEFLDDEGSWLRRIAHLVSGSWERADAALTHTTAQLVRQHTDLSDGPIALRAAWPHLVTWVRDHDDTEPIPCQTPLGSDVTDATPHLLLALQGLPVEQRLALVLHRLARLDDQTLAHCLDLPTAVVPALTAQAVEELQARLVANGEHLR
ncbi:MAG: hypothetical protein WAV52_06195, partial [Luteococcus japonicus]